MGYGRGGGKSQEFDNNMRGALFDKEPQTDKDPDYGGQCEIDGVEYWVAAWWKKSKKVGDYLSLSFTPKDERSSQRNDQRGPPRGRGPSSEPRGRGGPPSRGREPRPEHGRDGGGEEFDDDIPF